MAKAFITGTAGFIGFHLARRLWAEGWQVTGLDALSDYYDVSLKEARHAILSEYENFRPVIARLEEPGVLDGLLGEGGYSLVVHLAAQAGVRYSIDAPEAYLNSNLAGTFRLLEAVRHNPADHLLMASTSSIYGANTQMPYRETDRAVTQMSFYAATKAANEAMAHSYAHLYGLPTTMFRFFTVYGTWGRPDMAYFKFAKAIMKGDPIPVYNNGKMRRDFTYVDDLIEALVRLIPVTPPTPPNMPDDGDSLSPVAPFRVVNIGNADPGELLDYIAALENALGRKATLDMLPMQPGDVPATWADTALLQKLTGYCPSTPYAEGLKHFAEWFKSHPEFAG